MKILRWVRQLFCKHQSICEWYVLESALRPGPILLKYCEKCQKPLNSMAKMVIR
jgi:hypothetical protein